MKRVLVLCVVVGLLTVGCGDAPAPTVPPTDVPAESTSTPGDPGSGERRPGWITGKATDAQGHPLSNVRVVIRSGSVSMGSESYYEAEGDQAGRYAQQVYGTSYAITAYTSISYKGRTYKLWLDPLDGIDSPNQDVRGGLVKDFVLRLSGARPSAKTQPDSPDSYYGGVLDLGDDAEYRLFYSSGSPAPPPYPAGAKVRLELTPDGPLLDGTTGTVLSYDLEPETLATAVLRDVPLGDYIARATLVEAEGGTTALRVAARIADGRFGAPELGASAVVAFMPDRMGSFGASLVTLHILRQ